jgi:hypothetical protein
MVQRTVDGQKRVFRAPTQAKLTDKATDTDLKKTPTPIDTTRSTTQNSYRTSTVWRKTSNNWNTLLKQSKKRCGTLSRFEYINGGAAKNPTSRERQ